LVLANTKAHPSRWVLFMSNYPTLNQFQDYSRKVAKMEGQGFFLQKALIEYLLSNGKFANLFALGDGNSFRMSSIPQQDIELNQEQFAILQENLPHIIFRANEYLNENENRKNLEMKMMDESKQKYSERIAKESTENFKDMSKKMDDDMKKLGINWL